MNVGIYKILSPSGKVYIGQSWNIRKRWKEYGKPSVLKRQPAIFNSVSKYGILSHKFEIIHELPIDVLQTTLDLYEQLYMDFYRKAGFVLLNIREAGSRGALSQETKNKIRTKAIGRKASDAVKIKMSQDRKGVKKSVQHKINIGLSNIVAQKGIIAGEKNPKAKLTKEQVLEIRSKHIPFEKRNNVLLAKEYGVSVSTIERINNKLKSGSWK